jgi:hypothetical protein
MFYFLAFSCDRCLVLDTAAGAAAEVEGRFAGACQKAGTYIEGTVRENRVLRGIRVYAAGSDELIGG